MYHLITAKEINKAIETAKTMEFDFPCLAVRVHHKDTEVGAILEPSFVWVNGEETEEELNGTCGIDIDMKAGCDYMGDCLVVIGGYSKEWGEDAGETIIENAEVLAIL
jgi:hypothetical protein